MRKKREQQLLLPHYKKIHWTRRFANAIISKLEHLLMLNEKDKATSTKTYWIRITFFNKFTIFFTTSFLQFCSTIISCNNAEWNFLDLRVINFDCRGFTYMIGPLASKFLNTIGPIILFYCNTSFKFILLQHWL